MTCAFTVTINSAEYNLLAVLCSKHVVYLLHEGKIQIMLIQTSLPVRHANAQDRKLELWHDEHLKHAEWSVQWAVVLLTTHNVSQQSYFLTIHNTARYPWHLSKISVNATGRLKSMSPRKALKTADATTFTGRSLPDIQLTLTASEH